MQFILTGFSQEPGARVFAFEGVLEDRSRATFTVRADLALALKHGIPLQDLPLLCRGVLEKQYEGRPERSFAFTEEDMRFFREALAARTAAAKVRKAARRPPTANLGGAWRGHQR